MGMRRDWQGILRRGSFLALVALVALVAIAALAFCHHDAASLSAADVAALENADPANSLAIVFVRADSALDWSSPSRLTASTLANYLTWQAPSFSHPIGHAFVHLRCGGEGREGRSVWAGVTGGGTQSDLYRLIFGGEGLGLLTASFNGRMMTKAEVLGERSFHRTSGRAQRIRFLISATTCRRVLTYYDEFLRAKLYRTFGLSKRPRRREGAGCTTFVLSLLEIAGIKVPEAAWSISLRLPETLIGARGRSVGIFELLYAKAGQRWATPSERGVAFSFVDVSKAEEWVRRSRGAADQAAASAAFSAPTRVDDEGLIVDARAVLTPSEPLFYR